jgi:pimeloyl-ACP methyl ester carboxylesterase
MIAKKRKGDVTSTASGATESFASCPVLLVPGWGAPAWHTDWIAGQLGKAGLDARKLELPKMAVGDMVESAGLVAAEVDRMLADTGAERVNLVGYSLGGLICRIYLQELGGHKKLGRAVFVGAPQDGIYTAYLAAFTRGGRQVCKGSPFMKRLNAAGPCGCEGARCLSIFLSRDGTILPARSARLACGYNLELAWPVLHWGLVFNPGAIRALADFLKGGMPEGAVAGGQKQDTDDLCEI